MKIFFATNRNETGDPERPFGGRFHRDGSEYFRVGSAQLSRIGGTSGNDGFQVDAITIADERPPSRSGKEMLLGSTEVFSKLKGLMREEDRDALVYIHGFASTFELSLMRAALLKEKYLISGKQPHVFLFSWPSDGKVAPFWDEYNSDREDAQQSGIAMGRALTRLLEFLRSSRKEPRGTLFPSHSPRGTQHGRLGA